MQDIVYHLFHYLDCHDIYILSSTSREWYDLVTTHALGVQVVNTTGIRDAIKKDYTECIIHYYNSHKKTNNFLVNFAGMVVCNDRKYIPFLKALKRSKIRYYPPLRGYKDLEIARYVEENYDFTYHGLCDATAIRLGQINKVVDLSVCEWLNDLESIANMVKYSLPINYSNIVNSADARVLGYLAKYWHPLVPQRGDLVTEVITYIQYHGKDDVLDACLRWIKGGHIAQVVQILFEQGCGEAILELYGKFPRQEITIRKGMIITCEYTARALGASILSKKSLKNLRYITGGPHTFMHKIVMAIHWQYHPK